MPAENRREPRAGVRIAARLFLKENPSEAIECEILNISHGGAFVKTDMPVPLGEEILLEIRLVEAKTLEGRVIRAADLGESITLPDMMRRSVVKWARDSSTTGFGVQFVHLDAVSRDFLKKLVNYFTMLSKTGTDE